MRKTKEEKLLDKLFDDSYKRLASGVQFNIFDLSKISTDVRTAVKAGVDVDSAMLAAIAKYRVN